MNITFNTRHAIYYNKNITILQYVTIPICTWRGCTNIGHISNPHRRLKYLNMNLNSIQYRNKLVKKISCSIFNLLCSVYL